MSNTTFKFLLAAALLAGLAFPASARRGYIRTAGARVLEGHLRFESNAVVVVDAARELWALVPLTNITAFGFDAVVDSAPPAPNGPGPLPGPWTNDDIGSAGRAGDADLSGGMFRVRSFGTNVMGDGDSFHYVHKTITGESELVARLARVQSGDPWSAAGLMLRDGLAADARHVFLALTAGRGGMLVSRDRKGGETSVELAENLVSPAWLKLKRNGDTITAWRSANGQHWRLASRTTAPWPEEVLVGLAVAGGRAGVLNQSIFEYVEEAPSVRNRFFTPQVELLSGSMQPGYIAALDDTVLYFEGYARAPVTSRSVALIRFQAVPSRLAPLLSTGRTGVLLSTGEFIEGDCRRIERARVTVNSVPLGVRRYDVNNEVLAVVLGRRALHARRNYEVTTADGATWLALEVTLDRDGLLLREPVLGSRRISAHEIVELRRAG